MGELAFVQQRSADLNYYFMEAPAPRGAVRVLAERVLRLPLGSLVLAIIGSSHFLEIQARATVLCELLSCADPNLEGLPSTAEMAKGGEWSHGVRRRDVTYRFEGWRRVCSTREFETETARLSAPGAGELHYLFPQREGPGSALTSLAWQVEGSRATIATYHTFPNELTIVQTRSVIDFAEAGASS